MTDVALFNTLDGGEITIENGVIELGGGLESAAYLSLFGGNQEDAGERDSNLQWWGNLIEPNEVRHQRSRTQHIIRSLPLIPLNLRRIEDAATLDLAWMISEQVASSVVVTATMPALNRVQLDVEIIAAARITNIVFEGNWREDIVDNVSLPDRPTGAVPSPEPDCDCPEPESPVADGFLVIRNTSSFIPPQQPVVFNREVDVPIPLPFATFDANNLALLDGDPVTSWQTSEANIDAIQPNASEQPTFNTTPRNSVNFDGTDVLIDTTPPFELTGLDELSVTFVCEAVDGGSLYKAVFSSGIAGGSGGLMTAAFRNLGMYAIAGAGAGVLSTPSINTPGDWIVASYVWSKSTVGNIYEWWVNGVLQATDTSSAT